MLSDFELVTLPQQRDRVIKFHLPLQATKPRLPAEVQPSHIYLIFHASQSPTAFLLLLLLLLLLLTNSKSLKKSNTMATEAAARTFFSAPYFAVVGASADPSKFGHKSTSLHPTIFYLLSQTHD